VVSGSCSDRSYILFGDESALTEKSRVYVNQRLASDPRIASLSIFPCPDSGDSFLRATAPAGVAIAVATDTFDLIGPLATDASAQALSDWAVRASERGLWHDWLLSPDRHVISLPHFVAPSAVDLQESHDLSSSHHVVLTERRDRGEAITLTVDVTWLGPHQTGAQVLTTSAIEALAQQDSVIAIHLIGVKQLPTYAAHLEALDKVEINTDSEGPAQSDVIWYPNQIDQRVDITSARRLGRRVVATYLDLIAYDIPRYHASADAWVAYRSMQRRIALSVDGIATISRDVAHRLREEVPRLDPDRVEAIPLGLDHIASSQQKSDGEIAKLQDQLGNRPFLLVLGNDFQHKNRDFAIRVWERVLDKGVNCDLVLAGLHVRSSSSKDSENDLLAQHTNLRGVVHSIGHVSESNRIWLLENAAVVLYPSSAEGFGFVPYEAAALGTPSTFTEFGPLGEIAGANKAPGCWSIDEHSQDVLGLLTDPEAARQRVEELRTVIQRLTWDVFAHSFVSFIERVSDLPPAPGALTGSREREAAKLGTVVRSRTRRTPLPLRSLGKRLLRG
jgi:glycosyltransferase involved in cell wall biosynthesis